MSRPFQRPQAPVGLAESLKSKWQKLLQWLENQAIPALDKAGKLPLARQFFVSLQTRLELALNAIGQKLGLAVPVKTPRMAVTDSYTVAASEFIHDDAKEAATYQITFRRRPPWMDTMGVDPKDTRFVFYGLQQIVQEFFQNPVTMAEVNEAERYFKTARAQGKPVTWDRALWERVVKEKNGVLPIKIEALPEGSTFFPGEPAVQITAEEGFGELAAWFETKLVQLWATCETASMSKHWLEYNERLARETGDYRLTPEDVKRKANILTIDYSDRSSISNTDSERLSMAWIAGGHKTTSTLAAGYQAWKASDERPGAANASIKSLAHRVVQSFPEEGDAYGTLFSVSTAQGDWGSFVADCYDFKRAVREYLVPLAKQAQADGLEGVVCARPDSGDKYEQIRYVLDLAVQNGLYTTITTGDGRKLKAMTSLRVIEADGMNFKEIQEINERLLADGFSPTDCVYYGIGGYLRNIISRDNASVAMKLAALGRDKRPAMKFAPDAPGKESIPGEVKIVREAGQPSVRRLDEPGENELVTYYDGIGDENYRNAPGVTYHEAFDRIQKRVERSAKTPKPADDIISPAIHQLKDTLRAQYVEQAVAG